MSILDLIIKHHLVTLHIFGFFTLLYLGFLLKKFHNNHITNSVKISNHSLFDNLNIAIHELNSFSLSPHLLNRKFLVKMTIVKFEIWRDEALKLSAELDSKTIERNELFKRLISWEIETVNLYSIEWEKKHDIHPVLIKFYNRWHKKKVDKFHLSINQIFADTEIYGSYKSTLIAIFDRLDNLLLQTQSDLIHLIFTKHLNGDFVGIKYREIPVNDTEFEIFREVNFLK